MRSGVVGLGYANAGTFRRCRGAGGLSEAWNANPAGTIASRTCQRRAVGKALSAPRFGCGGAAESASP